MNLGAFSNRYVLTLISTIYLTACSGGFKSSDVRESAQSSSIINRLTPAPTPTRNLSYSGNSLGVLSHGTGYAQGSAWSADVQSGSETFLTYGPYTSQLAPGSYIARFTLLVDNNSADSRAVAFVDVNDAAHGQVLAKEEAHFGM